MPARLKDFKLEECILSIVPHKKDQAVNILGVQTREGEKVVRFLGRASDLDKAKEKATALGCPRITVKRTPRAAVILGYKEYALRSLGFWG